MIPSRPDGGRLETPVVLVIFNRPDFTEVVFRAIAQARPKRLFVIADGPRTSQEAVLCAETRAVIKVDWPCDLTMDVSEVNLGCRYRCASGFDMVFAQTETAIILEDDCVPDATFFPFCEEMLDRYRDDERVMSITGSNYLGRWTRGWRRPSYHFSYFGSPWGWASWRRAWKHYDVTMQAWGHPTTKARIRDVLGDDETYQFQARRFDLVHADRHAWDVAWQLTKMLDAGLTVIPAVNLIRNIGCLGENSIPPTHPVANLPTSPMSFPLRHPRTVAVDRAYDRQHVRRIVEGFATALGPPNSVGSLLPDIGDRRAGLS
jgi:hypothetical protein